MCSGHDCCFVLVCFSVTIFSFSCLINFDRDHFLTIMEFFFYDFKKFLNIFCYYILSMCEYVYLNAGMPQDFCLKLELQVVFQSLDVAAEN